MSYSINIICTKQCEDKFHYFIIIKNNEVEVDEWKYRIIVQNFIIGIKIFLNKFHNHLKDVDELLKNSFDLKFCLLHFKDELISKTANSDIKSNIYLYFKKRIELKNDISDFSIKYRIGYYSELYSDSKDKLDEIL